ncbi:winged helix-turn-helix transcriptional regulator [Nonomuraea sp. MG754425]|uniref:MarR family winged helix-turn-helix transcriptional regulator n=1 Tax=Nonomuraea sp. MG754425 TaxID=2570319 RepID=UPI001F15C72A|nr:MarR family winged helix-turn-helix transcriptional regulator [Nonomuraea sp. MG754425]MCF6468854.1 winged helix-turn-helix transcriptional regulator [Nonomuraea sp. MG754425]
MSDMDGGGPALFRLVRFWSRRWAGQAAAPTGEARHVQHVMVVEAVRTAPGEATVGTVAHQLGLDHSGASRMVKEAVDAGHLERATSPHDRRRAALRLTERGHALLAGSREWQRHAFDELTASWDEADRLRFAAYLRRLADEVGA